MNSILRALSIGALTLATACGGGQANAGASVNSDGTVSADANASVDTPVGTAGAGVSATAGGSVAPTPVPTSQGGYAATTVPANCVEEWVHMPLIINFPSGGAIIDAQNRAVLQEMVISAQARQDISAVRVEGHTDHCGNEANNMALSQQRAVTVANELVVMGVPRERVQTIGYGSRQPRANERCGRQQDSLSRATNRRVEFSVLVCRAY